MKKNITINYLQLLFFILIPTLLMSFISGSLVYSKISSSGKVVKTNNKHVNEFITAYNNLLENYYEDLDENKLIEAAINGMFNYTGDDYTIYMDEDATDSLSDKLEGTYEGIGIRISSNNDGQIYIYEVLDNTPAKEAGLEVNDILLTLNEKSLEGLNIEEVSNIIQTFNDNIVKLTVLRGNEELSFEIERKTLISPAITSSIKEVNNKKIGYIYIETFSNTVDTQVEATLISMENEGIDSLILDLRGNSGGYLASCTKILELFLEKGKLLYSIESKDGIENYNDSTETSRNYPIVVLINKGSASASEILSGALKYSYGATLIGTTSYGKGKVQNTGYLKDGTMYKYTSAKWLMPNGECIDGKGINPDIYVELDENFIVNRTEEYDNQLNQALNILTQ